MFAADQRDSVAARQSAHTAWRPTPRLVNTPLTVWTHPWNTGDMPDLTAGDSVVLGLHPVGPDLGRSTRSDAMKLLRLRDGQNQLLSGNVAGQRHVCWLRRNSPIRTDSFSLGVAAAERPRGVGVVHGDNGYRLAGCRRPH